MESVPENICTLLVIVSGDGDLPLDASLRVTGLMVMDWTGLSLLYVMDHPGAVVRDLTLKLDRDDDPVLTDPDTLVLKDVIYITSFLPVL